MEHTPNSILLQGTACPWDRFSLKYDLIIIDHAEDLHPSMVGLLMRLGGLERRPRVLIVVADMEIGMSWASLVAPPRM